ncbi:hypothetical protein SAMN05216481_10565 [Streptomyces radiopugnans]|uniref:Uncharacterized protein n=1 Tax=Streptomyces radiopugnans TaxID=403935 RepID=A0A1H9EEU3_9ACTN|nr:hypothetical protein SAMN05216481_10565 [Streptomyces radiopugnans]
MPSAPRAASQPPARNPFQAPDFGDLPDFDDAMDLGEPPFDADASAADEGAGADTGDRSDRKRPSGPARRRRGPSRAREARRGASRR